MAGVWFQGLAAQGQTSNYVYYLAKSGKDIYPRLCGEFEPQRALILSVSDWQPHHAPIFNEIVQKTKGHVDLVVLHNDRNQLIRTIDWLQQANLECDHVSFSQISLDSIWLRDFAPLFTEHPDGTVQALDFYYVGGVRPQDDKLAEQWCRLSDARLKNVPWTLQGGNLLVNGKSLGVTTNKVFQDNYITFTRPLASTRPEFDRRKIVADALIEQCNLKMLVVLEPLMNEATRHCDMFATFLAPDKIVVASIDPRRDPYNAALLDRNVQRLSQIKIGGRPLQVQRIRIPPRQGEWWSAYTNVIIANDLVLMPVMDSDPPGMIEAARRVYQQLLPDHEIETVNMTSMRKLQGELHCLSAHLPAFAPMPKNAISFSKVLQDSGQSPLSGK